MQNSYRIIVAGAGHGGLVAAKHLADAGFSVTVYESREREKLGYDWDDCIPKSVFEKSGITPPDEGKYYQMPQSCFLSPQKSVRVTCPQHKSIVCIGRKFLINHLIDECTGCGVDFVFGRAVTGLEYKNGKLCNVLFAGGKEPCDMVIDAAGIYSPLRECLPGDSLVQRKIADDDIFFAYRACFENRENIITVPPYNICFYHCGHKGMDWLITSENELDILAGSFGSLTDGDISESLDDYRKDFPSIPEAPSRGGYVGIIPVRRSMPVFVYNGYAAVGDSAFMTEPLSGSGLNLSMNAGKILADVIISLGGDYSAGNLWEYNRRYHEAYGLRQISADITRRLMVSLGAENMEYAFRTGIIGEKELAGKGKYTAADLVGKALNIAKRPSMLPALLRFFAENSSKKAIRRALPHNYDYGALAKWSELYMQKG